MFIQYLYQYCNFKTQQLLCRFMRLAIKVNYHSSTITIHMLSRTYKLPNVIHQKTIQLALVSRIPLFEYVPINTNSNSKKQ